MEIIARTTLGGRLLLAGACLVTITACAQPSTLAEGPVKVEIVSTDTGHQLLRGGVPYSIRGAGMPSGDIASFAAHGGNSIRTWTTRDGTVDTRQLLDEAHANGVTVALGLSMGSERHGFDYDDPVAVAAQLEEVRGEVIQYKDHPALLFWIIGNELNHSYTNPRVFDAVEAVARMIRELDPNHPPTTAVAGFKADVIEEIENRAPSLAFISFQLYGSIFALPDRIRELGFEAPFMVTEWGTVGYWEVEQTDWGAPIEATSSQKADIFRRVYHEILQPLEGQLLGSYAFFWGQKQERTSTWFGLLTERGEETEAIDILHKAWTGNWPANRTPQLRSLRLDGRAALESVRLEPGAEYFAEVDAFDPDGDPLVYRWELKHESDATQSGGDYEPEIASLEGFIEESSSSRVRITSPPPGAYRLFVYALDPAGNAAHANISFLSVDGDVAPDS
jgi:hypothetical protein